MAKESLLVEIYNNDPMVADTTANIEEVPLQQSPQRFVNREFSWL